MKKVHTSKKLLLLATSTALVIPFVVSIVQESVVNVEAATTVKLSEKKQGDIIKLGGVEYVVVSHKYGGVLVQSKDIVEPYATYDFYELDQNTRDFSHGMNGLFF